MSSQRFRAFSFIDKILSEQNSPDVLGHFYIASHLDQFPHALVAEAIGQLAAWYAIAQLGFKYRPVAALAGETTYHKIAVPGDLMTLKVNICSCDEDSIRYSGQAFCGNQLVLELNDCSGAMVPVDDFDDSSALRQDFEVLLSAEGAQPARLQKLPRVFPGQAGINSDGILEAELKVPEQADFLMDHFPRKAVLPATLLMDAFSQMLSPESLGSQYHDLSVQLHLRALRRIKVRSWTYPGECLTLKVSGLDLRRPLNLLRLTAHKNSKIIASAEAELAALGLAVQ